MFSFEFKIFSSLRIHTSDCRNFRLVVVKFLLCIFKCISRSKTSSTLFPLMRNQSKYVCTTWNSLNKNGWICLLWTTVYILFNLLTIKICLEPQKLPFLLDSQWSSKKLTIVSYHRLELTHLLHTPAWEVDTGYQ